MHKMLKKYFACKNMQNMKAHRGTSTSTNSNTAGQEMSHKSAPDQVAEQINRTIPKQSTNMDRHMS